MWLRRFLLILIIFLACYEGLSSNPLESDFQINFNIAKRHLSQKEVLKALPYLQYLLENNPNNSNLKYLIGLCYVEAEITNPEALALLEEVSSNPVIDYNPNLIKEERVPVYALYYLSVAYAQNKRCEEAKKVREEFIKVYPYQDQYYNKESLKWIQRCEKMLDKPILQELPKFPDFKPYVSGQDFKGRVVLKPKVNNEIKTGGATKNVENILTKRIEYSAKSPIYGVQLGAFHEVIPVSRFEQLKNVDAFVDRQGLIRYVIGKFSIHSQAMSLLDVVKAKGYEDAFVVNINDNRKFEDEVVSVDNMNINAKIHFRVQIGAFREKIPLHTATIYFKIEGIKVHNDDAFTYLSVGKFDDYERAKSYEKELKKRGIEDAFVIAIANGKKISLEKTKNSKK